MSLWQFVCEEPFYAFTFLLTGIILGIHLTFVFTGRMMERRAKLCTLFGALMIAFLSTDEFIGVYLDNVNGGAFRPLHIAVKYVELSLTPVLPIVMGFAVNPRHSVKWVALPIVLSLLLEAVMLPFGLVFRVDESDVYHHGAFYWIYIVMIIGGALFMCCEFYIQAKRFQNKQNSYIFLTLLLPLVCFLMHIFVPEIRMSWLGVSISLVFIYCAHCNVQLCTDHITKLLDRASFDKDLMAMKKGDTLIFFDINKFKQLNDEHGHAVGDEYLSTIAQFLRNAYDGVGRSYRIGGDEFAVIVYKKNANVNTVNEAFLALLENARERDPLLPRIAIGSCTYTGGDQSKIEVFNTADMRMYSNKAEGSHAVD